LIAALAATGALAVPVIATGATVSVSAKAVTKPDKDKVVIKGTVNSPSRDCRTALVGIAQLAPRGSDIDAYKTVKPEGDGSFRAGFDHPKGKVRRYIVYAPNSGRKPGCPQAQEQLGEVKNVD
jgi:hypothetical protein